MTNKQREAMLLEEAYSEVNEGIFTRLKGQVAGMGAGLKQGAQNIATGVAGKLGATVTPLGKADLATLKASHPEIEQVIKSSKALLEYLKKKKYAPQKIASK